MQMIPEHGFVHAVQHLSLVENGVVAELSLIDREAQRVTGGALLAGQRIGHLTHPAQREMLHQLRGHLVRSPLQCRGVRDLDDAVVGGAEGDMVTAEVRGQIPVGIPPQAHLEGRVRADADEAVAKLAIAQVEVVVVDQPAVFFHPEVGGPTPRMVAGKHACRLLVHDDPDDAPALPPVGVAEEPLSNFARPRPALDAHNRDVSCLREGADLRHEAIGQPLEDQPRQDRFLADLAEELGHRARGLQRGDVGGEDEPVNRAV